MNICPRLQVGRAVVQIEAIWHASTQLTHEEWVGHPGSERYRCFERRHRETPATQGNACHSCRRRPDNINCHDCVALAIGLYALGKAVNHYRLAHGELLPKSPQSHVLDEWAAGWAWRMRRNGVRAERSRHVAAPRGAHCKDAHGVQNVRGMRTDWPYWGLRIWRYAVQIPQRFDPQRHA